MPLNLDNLNVQLKDSGDKKERKMVKDKQKIDEKLKKIQNEETAHITDVHH